MNVGEYPCCGEELFLPIPDRPLPVIACHNCPHCGEKVWHKYSRFDPQTWTDAGFLEEFNVDETTKKITRKDGSEIKPDAVVEEKK